MRAAMPSAPAPMGPATSGMSLVRLSTPRRPARLASRYPMRRSSWPRTSAGSRRRPASSENLLQVDPGALGELRPVGPEDAEQHRGAHHRVRRVVAANRRDGGGQARRDQVQAGDARRGGDDHRGGAAQARQEPGAGGEAHVGADETADRGLDVAVGLREVVLGDATRGVPRSGPADAAAHELTDEPVAGPGGLHRAALGHPVSLSRRRRRGAVCRAGQFSGVASRTSSAAPRSPDQDS